MSFVYGNTAGPGPSYYRVVIDPSWSNLGNGYYRCYANIRVQVTAGDFYGTYIQTSWGTNENVYGPGDYCYKDLGYRDVPYGGSWIVSGNAWYNSYSSSISHTFKPPKPTYAVNYNANGGSGAPGKQIKTWGTNLTLSKTIPTRSGYKFLGWGTSSADTTPDYQPGGTYSINAGITLYAIWKRKGQLHIVQDGRIKKGRAYLKKDNVWKTGIPWMNVKGTWKRGGV